MTRATAHLGSGLQICALLLANLLPTLAQTPNAPQQPAPLLRVGTEEVLLDLVVRDKRGRPITDLQATDIEVYEDGVKQQLSSFHLVNRAAPSATGADGKQTAAHPVNAAPKPGQQTPDPLRQVNLVTMVFERLNNESRQLAQQAALDFLQAAPDANVFISVYYLDQRLRLLQPFTSDRALLRAAIASGTGKAAAQFTDKSDTLRREMETLIRTQDLSANPQAGGPGVDPGPQAARNAVAMKFAEIVVNTLRLEDDMQRQQQGSASVYSLLSLIGGLSHLYGRKTVLYFSEGMHVPPNLVEAFHATISAANRVNLSFYALDARGLLTARQGDAMRDELAAAARASESQQRARGGQAVTFEQAKIFDAAESSIRRNTQNTLGELAEGTGGFLIANTNDLRKPLRRIADELSSYYELTYAPAIRQYDGKFRSIKVKALRADIVVQTRNGYFALPPVASGAPLMPWELPLLAALSGKSLPRDFDYRATTLRFEPSAQGVQHTLLMEVPLAHLTFNVDQVKKTYHTNFALLALIKDANGHVVERFSQGYPFEGPLDRLAALQRGNVVFTRNLRLAPGRYTLETGVHDRATNKLTARRSILMVPPRGESIGLSSVAVIKRVDPVDPNVKDQDNPLRFTEGRIVPNLGDLILPTPGTKISFYFVVYPAGGASEPPRLTLEFLRDGEVIARATPELPAPDAQGRIPYISTVPMETFKAGRYELRAIAQQGTRAVEEHAFFTIAAPAGQ